jgi:hypothetical protein
MSNLKQTAIQSYTTAKIASALTELKSVSKVKHPLLTGELRESFITNLLNHFIPERYGIGSGVIVNPFGKQSKQWDIIIYDKDILPTFVFEMSRGLFPAEAVLAVIEVKSKLTKVELIKINSKAQDLFEKIFNIKYFLYKDRFTPLIGAFGLYGTGAKELQSEKGAIWVETNLNYLNLICLCEKYCLLKVWGKWAYSPSTETHEEVKRFIFPLLDNIRTKALKREDHFRKEHKDWFSIYARDQEGIRKYFEDLDNTDTAIETTTTTETTTLMD